MTMPGGGPARRSRMPSGPHRPPARHETRADSFHPAAILSKNMNPNSSFLDYNAPPSAGGVA
jgi:hypothetical protein